MKHRVSPPVRLRAGNCRLFCPERGSPMVFGDHAWVVCCPGDGDQPGRHRTCYLAGAAIKRAAPRGIFLPYSYRIQSVARFSRGVSAGYLGCRIAVVA